MSRPRAVELNTGVPESPSLHYSIAPPLHHPKQLEDEDEHDYRKTKAHCDGVTRRGSAGALSYPNPLNPLPRLG